MKTYILFFLLVFAFNFNVSAQKNEINKSNSVSSETKGQVISLDKFKGSVLVLYFFGDIMDNWDQPISELNRLKAEFKNNNVHVSALSSKTQEEIDSYMETIDFIMLAKSIDFKVVTDSDSAKKYKIKPPYVYVIEPDGKIYWKGKSLSDVSEKVNEVLNNSSGIQIKGTNVYNEKITGDVVRLKTQLQIKL